MIKGAAMSNNFLELRKKIIKKEFFKMNDEQKKAIFQTEGPLLLLAGAGSGKTTVIVNRILGLIKFGKAYHSDKCEVSITDFYIKRMQDYYNGDNSAYYDIQDLLSVEAPKPWEILAITFTNKAAGELKERLVKLLGEAGSDVWASTFHSFCSKVLRRNADLLGYTSSFTIYDTDDSKRLIKECMRQLRIDEKMITPKTVLSEISRAKNSLISPREHSESVSTDIRLKQISDIYEKYQHLIKKADAMDFDDMIFNTVRLLENNEEVRNYYQNKFKYLMVDEYQDTNNAQYVLISLLAAKRKNICVVGDDDQSIYKFRGATIENILNFEKHYKNTTVIRLEQNYRSTQTILDAANAVISNNEQRKGKNLWTSNGTGEKIIVNTAYDEQDEARYVANIIMDHVSQGQKWQDHTILYRTNSQSNAIETTFVRLGVPYRVIGGHRFYDRKEIKDAIAYLTVVNNPSDDIRLQRIINEPKRSIGKVTITHALEIAAGIGVSLYEVLQSADSYPTLSRAVNKIQSFVYLLEELREASEVLPLNELFETIMKKSGYVESLALDTDTYKDRLENITELSTNIQKYSMEVEDATLSGFLEEVSLMSDIDNYNSQSDTVTMMTLHSAKGLEFPNVFLVGMEEGLFPGMQSMYIPSEIEEERRLAYVGITRAKKNLYITNTKTRMIYGSTTHNRPSRFVEEIPNNLVEDTSKNSILQSQKIIFNKQQTYSSKATSSSRDFGTKKELPDNNVDSGNSDDVFKVGDSVVHKAFGEGMILSINKLGNDFLVEIAFNKVGTKKLMQKFAKLKKV